MVASKIFQIKVLRSGLLRAFFVPLIVEAESPACRRAWFAPDLGCPEDRRGMWKSHEMRWWLSFSPHTNSEDVDTGWVVSGLNDMENAILPLQGSFARRFAQEWVNGWNSHDLDRILDHYDDEVVLISPVALRLLNNGDGMVKGKAALSDYFFRGLQAFPNLRFDLIDVLAGVETIVVCYANNVRGGKAAEVMQLNAAGKIRRVWANYDQ
jgi:hypothetical protein